MTRAQEAAIARVCAHECMQRELVEALQQTASTLQIACIAITDDVARGMALDVVKQARAVLARAKERA